MFALHIRTKRMQKPNDASPWASQLSGSSYCFVPMMCMPTTFASPAIESPALVDSSPEDLNSHAAELLAKAHEAEQAAQMMRVKARAPWRRAPTSDAEVDGTPQSSFQTEAPMMVMEVDGMQQSSFQTEAPMMAMPWMPVFFMQMSVPIPADAVPYMPSVACQAAPDHLMQKDEREGVFIDSPEVSTERSTLMMRNIPNNYTRDMLLELLDAEGFQGRYNFVYLPIDFQRLSGIGYAFVNFETSRDAEEAKETFQGFSDWKISSNKTCAVSWGEPLQGLQSHVDRYRNSPLMHADVPDQYRPVLLKDGIRQPFPEPTKRIRPPRMKHGGIPGMLPDFLSK